MNEVLKKFILVFWGKILLICSIIVFIAIRAEFSIERMFRILNSMKTNAPSDNRLPGFMAQGYFNEVKSLPP